MSETVSFILFCIFSAVFLGLIITNIMLVKQAGRRVILFLATIVLPFIPFLLYYYAKAPGLKGTEKIPGDIEKVLLKMDLLAYYLIAVFLIQSAIALFIAVKRWKRRAGPSA